MEIKIIGRVLDVNVKNAQTYLTMLDTEQGGNLKLTIPGVSAIKLDDKISIHASVKPGIGQYGLFLKVVEIFKEGDK